MLAEDELYNLTGALRALFAHPNKQETLAAANKFYDYLQELAEKSPAQVREEGINMDEKVQQFTKGNLLLEIYTPAIEAVIQHGYKNKADVEATLTILALLRYKQNTGSFPANLNELVESDYLKEKPGDPYGSGVLKYEKQGDDFVLYSLGADFYDGGGLENPEDKWGRKKQGSDKVFWPVQR